LFSPCFPFLEFPSRFFLPTVHNFPLSVHLWRKCQGGLLLGSVYSRVSSPPRALLRRVGSFCAEQFPIAIDREAFFFLYSKSSPLLERKYFPFSSSLKIFGISLPLFCHNHFFFVIFCADLDVDWTLFRPSCANLLRAPARLRTLSPAWAREVLNLSKAPPLVVREQPSPLLSL